MPHRLTRRALLQESTGTLAAYAGFGAELGTKPYFADGAMVQLGRTPRFKHVPVRLLDGIIAVLSTLDTGSVVETFDAVLGGDENDVATVAALAGVPWPIALYTI